MTLSKRRYEEDGEEIMEKRMCPSNILDKGGVLNPTDKQLMTLIGTVCRNNTEKYQLLQERDELMYKARIKNRDVTTMENVIGTCPDMCPEKERYMRDVQSNLSRYECDLDGRMLPEKTVKNYSRSAADQEEPLPHELRPVKVLQITMDYLINEIADKVPTNSAELVKWYDFLWGRTRSIRKDITQQMLHDEMSVDLVEKCARFHIFAAFNLSHLDAADFSQKMNTENLSKCLQTLKHMYEDLAEEGKWCKNEAEFRAYDIILNLDDNNVCSQVLSYREVIRESPDVRLALDLATSLQNNNYVRFFRLLKFQGDFLQCCLAHRYFSLMRFRALKVLCAAYRLYPQEKFADLLGFGNSTDSIKFVNRFGIDIDYSDSSLFNVQDGKASFARGEIANPETLPQGECNWIQEKMQNNTLAGILYKGAYTYSPPPRPTNSFDLQDRYTSDPFNPASRRALSLLPPIPPPPQQQQQQQQQQPLRSTLFNEDFSSTSKQFRPRFMAESVSLDSSTPIERTRPKFALPKSSKLFNALPILPTSKPSVQKPVSKPLQFTFTSNFTNGDSTTTTKSNESKMAFSFKPSSSGSLNQSQETVKSSSTTPSFMTTPKVVDFKLNIFNNNNNNIEADFSKIVPLYHSTPKDFQEAVPKVVVEPLKPEMTAEVFKAPLQRGMTTIEEPIIKLPSKEEPPPPPKVISRSDAESFMGEAMAELQNSTISIQIKQIAENALENAKIEISNRLEKIRENLFLLWQRQFIEIWLKKTRRSRLMKGLTQNGKAIPLVKPGTSLPNHSGPGLSFEETKLRLLTFQYHRRRNAQLQKEFFQKWQDFVALKRSRRLFEQKYFPYNKENNTPFCKGLYSRLRERKYNSTNYISFKDDLAEERERNIERLYQEILKKKQATNGFNPLNNTTSVDQQQKSELLNFSTPQFHQSSLRNFVPEFRSFT